MEDVTVGGTLEERSKTIGNVSERLGSEKLQWSSTEDGPSHQENVGSRSRSDLRLSFDDGIKKYKRKRKVKLQDMEIKTKDTRKEGTLPVVAFACYSSVFVECIILIL